MRALVVLGFVFPHQAKRLAWRTSPKWPILCRVGRKTLAQSINKQQYYMYVLSVLQTRQLLCCIQNRDTSEKVRQIALHIWNVCRCLVVFVALLWSPYVIGQTIIFLPCDFYLSIFFFLFFSSPNLGGRRLDVYHTSTHGVALVRI